MANIMNSAADISYGTANMAYKEAKIWLPKSHYLKFLNIFMPADPPHQVDHTVHHNSHAQHCVGNTMNCVCLYEHGVSHTPCII